MLLRSGQKKRVMNRQKNCLVRRCFCGNMLFCTELFLCSYSPLIFLQVETISRHSSERARYAHAALTVTFAPSNNTRINAGTVGR